MSKYGNAVGVQDALNVQGDRVLDLEARLAEYERNYILLQGRLRKVFDELTDQTGERLSDRFAEDIRQAATKESNLGQMTIETIDDVQAH